MGNDNGSVHGHLRRIADAAEFFHSFAGAQVNSDIPDIDQLINVYIETKGVFAREFMALAEMKLGDEINSLDSVKSRIKKQMESAYGGRIPDRYIKISGYAGLQPILFEYLLRHVGEPVSTSRLRVLSGDQIHTERRTRDLRDLGLDVEAVKVSDDNQYVLHSPEPDIEAAAEFQIKKNIKGDKKLTAPEKAILLAQI